jgi:hypothetical protein
MAGRMAAPALPDARSGGGATFFGECISTHLHHKKQSDRNALETNHESFTVNPHCSHALTLGIKKITIDNEDSNFSAFQTLIFVSFNVGSQKSAEIRAESLIYYKPKATLNQTLV